MPLSTAFWFLELTTYKTGLPRTCLPSSENTEKKHFSFLPPEVIIMGSVDETYPLKGQSESVGSGGFTYRQRSILSFARDNDVDVIIGNWMSGMTMQCHGAAKT